MEGTHPTGRYPNPKMGHCERVLHFTSREGRYKSRMRAVKWVVAKLQGDNTTSFCRNMSGREVTGRYVSIAIFHGTLLPMDFWTPSRFLTKVCLWVPESGHDMRGLQNVWGGGKRTRERALPKNSGPLQKSFWSAQSWTFVQEEQSNDTREGWKTYRTSLGPLD